MARLRRHRPAWPTPTSSRPRCADADVLAARARRHALPARRGPLRRQLPDDLGAPPGALRGPGPRGPGARRATTSTRRRRRRTCGPRGRTSPNFAYKLERFASGPVAPALGAAAADLHGLGHGRGGRRVAVRDHPDCSSSGRTSRRSPRSSRTRRWSWPGATSTWPRAATTATRQHDPADPAETSATANTASRASSSTTIRSSGARGGSGPTCSASAASTPTSGTSATSRTRARRPRSRSCRPTRGC